MKSASPRAAGTRDPGKSTGISGLGKATIAVCALIVPLVVADVLVRLLAPQVTLYPRYVESDQYRIEFPPRSALVQSQGWRWKYVYHTNVMGRRGSYVAPHEATGRAAVALLGDSFTFGIGVSDDEVYSARLSTLLGKEYVVINGGVSGWGLDSEIKWYYHHAAQYNPRFVVLQFTANDPDDDVGLTTIDSSGQFRFHPYHVRKPKWQRAVSESWVLQNSQLYALARSIDLRPRRARTEAAAFDVSSPAAVSRQERYVRLLEAFATKLAAEGRDLLFLSVTHEDRAAGRYIHDVDMFPPILRSVHALEAAHALTFIELPLEQMRRYDGSPEGHQWGEVHHQVVAEVLARAITATQPAAEASVQRLLALR